jgi:hypothetical protein
LYLNEARGSYGKQQLTIETLEDVINACPILNSTDEGGKDQQQQQQ